MSAVVAPRRYGTVAADDNRRTALWLVGIVVVVSLLTSNALWAQLGDLFGVGDADYHAQDAAPPPKLDREMVELIKLTEDPAQMIVEAPETAITRNEAIPFDRGPVVKARPFVNHPASEITPNGFAARNAKIDSKNVSPWISVPSRSTASGKSAVPCCSASADILGPVRR